LKITERLPRALADRRLVAQILTNLMSKAIKFTSRQDKAIIEVTAVEYGDRKI
jgi:signal transduction histidine kinase